MIPMLKIHMAAKIKSFYFSLHILCLDLHKDKFKSNMNRLTL